MAADTFSFSRVTTFEQCARRYRYRYLDGVAEGFQGVEGFMGTQVHSVIEWLYTERFKGRSPDLAAANARYQELWAESLRASPAPVRVVRPGDILDTYRVLGEQIVGDFFRQRFECDDSETVALERHFEIELQGGYRFQGFIDRLARGADGRLRIIDFKTGKRVPLGFEGKDAEQLMAYSVAMFREFEDDEVSLELEYLREMKVVKASVHRRDSADTESMLAARVRTATEATVFPPNPGILCCWCGFNDLCDKAKPWPQRRRR